MSEPIDDDLDIENWAVSQIEHERAVWAIRWPDLVDDPKPDPSVEEEIERLMNWQESDEESQPETEDAEG